ncbi:MAG: hypothetical protein JOZ51_06350 [Chloroflexi bacterium]|nr:hypothetical protein [Chloroflexota bacterium]
MTATQSILAFLWVGIAVGRLITVMLVLHQRSKHMLDRRWFVVCGGPLLAIFILLIPQARSTGGGAISLILFGTAAAQFRIGAWLWQSAWVLALVSTTTFTRRLDRIDIYLPASFDQLRFLPLAGTTALLRRQSHVCAYQTSSWIIQLAAYPNDRSLARRFIANMPQEPQAYATLFWLSLDPAGQALLQSLTKPHQRAPAMVHAYAQLSQVVAPGAWRVALEHAARALIAAPPPTDIPWLPQCIATAQIILEARSWEHVQQGMLELVEAVHEASPAIEDTLIALREQIHHTLRAHLATDLRATWPLRLLATATEQLTFLKSMA